MTQFHIYLSTGKDKFQEVENQPREYAGFVEAVSLEEAYIKSQNHSDSRWENGSNWNITNPCRNTSVGDVIESDEGFYMVCGMGFRLLDETSKNDAELNSLENQSNEC